MAALRAGWRAEAEARGFSDDKALPARASAATTEFFDPDPLDGFPSESKSKRKGENKANNK
jgi:hypothetical protein